MFFCQKLEECNVGMRNQDRDTATLATPLKQICFLFLARLLLFHAQVFLLDGLFYARELLAVSRAYCSFVGGCGSWSDTRK